MIYLLDASALVELFLSLNASKLINILDKCCILDLTIYEFCNALWKLAKLRGKIDEETAITGAKLLEKLVSGKIIRVVCPHTSLEARMKKSLQHYLNAYDAAYMHTAKNNNLILVTEDPGMHSNAKTIFNLEVLSTSEFLRTIPKK